MPPTLLVPQRPLGAAHVLLDRAGELASTSERENAQRSSVTQSSIGEAQRAIEQATVTWLVLWFLNQKTTNLLLVTIIGQSYWSLAIKLLVTCYNLYYSKRPAIIIASDQLQQVTCSRMDHCLFVTDLLQAPRNHVLIMSFHTRNYLKSLSKQLDSASTTRPRTV